MKLFAIFLLCLLSSIGYYELYVWECVMCNCKYYGRNPPAHSRCLKNDITGEDIWELKEVRLIPVKGLL